jgi:16S rRNA (uracil1498-N3)-methyltransferase
MRSKTLRRFFVEEIRENNGLCSITGPEAKHITKVLRMRPGDRFILMDGKGARFQVLIEFAGAQEVGVVVEKPVPKPPHSPVEITVCQAFPKSRAMDYLIQKTSELGVDCIIPFSSERTVVRFKEDRLANKMRHWCEIAQNSAKQCDRSTPAKIEQPSSFRDVMRKWSRVDALKVVLWEEEGAKDLKSLLRAPSSAKDFAGMVGPEGGFTGEEIDVARDAGFISVSLGNRILRAETAAITMVAIVQYELGDLNL